MLEEALLEWAARWIEFTDGVNVDSPVGVITFRAVLHDLTQTISNARDREISDYLGDDVEYILTDKGRAYLTGSTNV